MSRKRAAGVYVRPVHVPIDPGLLRRAKAAAKAAGVTLYAWVDAALVDAMDEPEDGRKAFAPQPLSGAALLWAEIPGDTVDRLDRHLSSLVPTGRVSKLYAGRSGFVRRAVVRRLRAGAVPPAGRTPAGKGRPPAGCKR
jgi:hypothetical protein